MNFRKAELKDVPALVNAIIEIEKTEKSDTFSNLFGTNINQTKEYLTSFFLDSENFGNEFSIDTYIIAEIDNEYAGSCSLIYTNNEYHINRSDLFLIHLKKEHLDLFANNIKNLPHSKDTLNMYFTEYIFVDKNHRRKNVTKNMIDEVIKNNKLKEVYVNVLQNNIAAIETYKKIDFHYYLNIEIDNHENKIFPCKIKNVMRRDIIIN